MSPIADALRSKMGEVNWARAGLGLPLVSIRISLITVVLNSIQLGFGALIITFNFTTA